MRFCPKCGAEVPEGSKFCGSCGQDMSEFQMEPPEQETSDSGASTQITVVGNNPGDPGNAGGQAGQPADVLAKKKLSPKVLIGVVAAVVVVLIAAFAILNSGGASSSENAIIYGADGKYGLLDLKKDKTIEISPSRSDKDFEEDMVQFSPDGKYVYYYTKLDTETYTGSLCRAEYGNLKENSTKNENYIEVIATNVTLGFRFLDDGSLLYRTGDDTLYWYNGKEVVQIAKSILSYYTDGSNRVAYTVANSNDAEGTDDEVTLYGVNLANADNKKKLVSNCSYVYDAEDLDHIFYVRFEEEEGQTLYVVGLESEVTKLGENANVYGIEDGVAYYTAANGQKLNLYDYVSDTSEAEDKNNPEPNIEDYAIPEYSYYSMYYLDDPDDYDKIYTSCTQPVRFYSTGWYTRSLEYAAEHDDEYGAVYAAFVKKYKSKEDKDGYIEVTDVVKNDLISLVQAVGEEEPGEWLELCFTKKRTGNTYDYDAYELAEERYNAARKRIFLREQLKDPQNAFKVSTLYRYEDGKTKAIHEAVLDALVGRNNVMFNTVDMVTEKKSLESIDSVADCEEMFFLQRDAPNYVLSTEGNTSGTVYRMSQSAADAYSEARQSGEGGYASLCFAGSDLYMEHGEGLAIAKIANGKIESFSQLTDESASIYGNDDSRLYYVEGWYESNSQYYCNLCCCENGKSKRLAQDVMVYGINLYEDDTVLVYTAGSGDRYELTKIAPNGEKTIISDSVSRYIRLDLSTILFLSDGDLYTYNGKEKSMVKEGVDYIWTRDQMDSVLYRNDYGYF